MLKAAHAEGARARASSRSCRRIAISARPNMPPSTRIQAKKWEATRGMSHSFGFNRRDTEADYESVESLVHKLHRRGVEERQPCCSMSARAARMRRSPPNRSRALKGFGAWLKANGEGIYGTRPWTRFDGTTRMRHRGALHAEAGRALRPSARHASRGANSSSSATTFPTRIWRPIWRARKKRARNPCPRCGLRSDLEISPCALRPRTLSRVGG